MNEIQSAFDHPYFSDDIKGNFGPEQTELYEPYFKIRLDISRQPKLLTGNVPLKEMRIDEAIMERFDEENWSQTDRNARQAAVHKKIETTLLDDQGLRATTNISSSG